MLNRSKKETANKQLKSLYLEYLQAFNSAKENSKRAFLENMQPGATMPANININIAERSKLNDKTLDIKRRANDILDDLINEAGAGIATAPTQEEINAVQMLVYRSNVSVDEIDFLLTVNKDNVQTYNAIKDIAFNKFDIKDAFKDHPAVVEFNDLYGLKEDFNRINGMTNDITPGAATIMKNAIDAVLSAE